MDCIVYFESNAITFRCHLKTPFIICLSPLTTSHYIHPPVDHETFLNGFDIDQSRCRGLFYVFAMDVFHIAQFCIFQIRNKAWDQICVDSQYDAKSAAKKAPKTYNCHYNGGNQVNISTSIPKLSVYEQFVECSLKYINQ